MRKTSSPRVVAAPADVLVGRASELAELGSLVKRAWLVTVLGPAGIGKTRLARTLAARGGASVRWVELEHARNGDDVARALAEALSVATLEGDEVQTLARAIEGMTLVLDNAEQVAGDVAEWVGTLHAHAPSARFLVTSRERLRVAGEATMPLGPLAEPDAVALFHERARERRSDYRADDALAHAIVTRLDCIPLAIELAAAQTVVLGLADLLAHLERDLAVLRTDVRGAPERQATLLGAIEWSWRLLDEDDQRALARCAVFAAPFPLDAGVALLDEPKSEAIARLRGLVERSLLRVVSPAGIEQERWLDSYFAVRQVAAEKLRARGEWDLAMERASGELLASSQTAHGDAGFVRLAARAVDLRGVVSRAVAQGDGDAAAQAFAGIGLLVSRRGPVGAALDLADSVVAIAQGPARSLALRTRARLRTRAGDHDGAESDLVASLAIPDVHDDERHVDLAELYRRSGRVADAEALYRRAVAARDAQTRGRGVVGLAGLLHEVGRIDEAHALYDEVLAEFTRRGDRLNAGVVLQNLGILEQERGDFELAEGRFRRALALHQEVGHLRYEGVAYFDLAGLDLERGAVRAARDGYARALELLTNVGDQREAALSLALRAASASACGSIARAESEFEEAAHSPAARHDANLRDAIRTHRGHLDLARGALALREGDAAAFSRGLARARARLEDSHEPANDEVRYARRVLARRLAEHEAHESALVIAPDAGWLRAPGSEPVDLSRRETLRGIVAGLLEQRLREPSRGLDHAALLAAGWGDERMSATAGKNRVQVALSQLRRFGLAEILVRDEVIGYRLDAQIPVVVCGARAQSSL